MKLFWNFPSVRFSLLERSGHHTGVAYMTVDLSSRRYMVSFVPRERRLLCEMKGNILDLM